jgi:MYXO-CTERM domain-containing protein
LGVAAAAPAVREARACSGGGPTATYTTLPRTGATDVPTASSFIIASGAAPTDLVLKAGDVDVPLKAPTSLGPGREAKSNGHVTFWKVETVSGFLPASADLVLSAAGPQGGPRVVLTSVKTAAGYDKQPGTPATLKRLKLTRVRYPVEEIGAGGCVFAEYIGYISFESDPATFPGTPADSIVNTITLYPKNGGAAEQSFTYDGSEAYTGSPPGVFWPGLGWMPQLDPTLEYCATIQSFGVGDIAREAVTSNTVCASVEQISSSDAGAQPDGGAPPPSSDGCAVAGGAPPSPALALLGLVGLAARSRRRLSDGTSARRT